MLFNLSLGFIGLRIYEILFTHLIVVFVPFGLLMWLMFILLLLRVLLRLWLVLLAWLKIVMAIGIIAITSVIVADCLLLLELLMHMIMEILIDLSGIIIRMICLVFNTLVEIGFIFYLILQLILICIHNDISLIVYLILADIDSVALTPIYFAFIYNFISIILVIVLP